VSGVPPGWFDDPERRHDKRYWDGQAWTGAVMDGGQVGSDPRFQEPAVTPRSASDVVADLNAQPLATSLAHAGAHGTYTSLDPHAVCRELPARLSAQGVGIVDVRLEQIQGIAPAGSSIEARELVVVVLLMFLCLIPGIVYLFWTLNQRRDIPFSLMLLPQGGGTVIVPQPLEINQGPVGMVLQGLPR
jgi:hypothetical protein